MSFWISRSPRRLVLVCVWMMLQYSPQSSGMPAQEQQPVLQMVPKTSLPSVSAGANFGISIDVKNISSHPIYLHPQYFTLSLPPELDSRAPYAWWALFPGGSDKPNQSYYDRTIYLGPGDTITAFWAGARLKASSASGFWARQFESVASEARFLTFEPGEYTLKVVAIYWTDEHSVGNPLANSSTVVLDVKVPITAPQWVIITGAIIGGVIAYLLLPRFRLRPGRISLAGIGTAALLSVIVTILLARISETQFFIKVSVNDLWGSIAIGFIATASGTNILKKLIPTEAMSSKKTNTSAVTSGNSTALQETPYKRSPESKD